MNTLVQFIKENKNSHVYMIKPQTKEELQAIIEKRIEEQGPECVLNDIDVSEITDMKELFHKSKFNGDISDWNVENVEEFKDMFDNCPIEYKYKPNFNS